MTAYKAHVVVRRTTGALPRRLLGVIGVVGKTPRYMRRRFDHGIEDVLMEGGVLEVSLQPGRSGVERILALAGWAVRAFGEPRSEFLCKAGERWGSWELCAPVTVVVETISATTLRMTFSDVHAQRPAQDTESDEVVAESVTSPLLALPMRTGEQA